MSTVKKNDQRTACGFDIALRYGLLSLLVWTPLAFGAVHTWAYALLEIHVWLLVGISLIRYVKDQYRASSTAHPARFIRTPLAWPLILFFVLLIIQQVPLPDFVLSLISPASAELYRLFLPGWPERYATISLAPYTTYLAWGQYLAYASVFVLFVNTLRTRRDIQSVCWVVFGTSCVMAIVGILQDVSGTQAIYWWRDASYADDRFFGPYLNRNHFAGYQAIAIVLGLGLLMTQPLRVETTIQLLWRRRLFQLFGLLTPARLFLICGLSIIAGSMIAAASRGGALSLLLSLTCLMALLCWRRMRLRRQAVLTFGLLSMVGIVLWLGMAPLLLRFEQLASDSSAQLWAGRWPAFQAAWRISQDFPLFGIGYEAFSVLSARYQPIAEVNPRYYHVHNDFLQLLAETGWIGFGLLVGGVLLTVWAIVVQWRTRRDPFVQIIVAAGLAALCAIGLHSLVDFNLHIPANALLFTTVLAMTFACANLPRYRTRYPTVEPAGGVDRVAAPARRVGLTWLAGFGLLAMGWLTVGSLQLAVADLIYPQQEVLQPDHWVYRAQPDAARKRLQHAMTWTPKNPWYWHQLARLETQMVQSVASYDDLTGGMQQHAWERLERAANAYDRALQGQPTEPDIQLGLLNVHQRLARWQSPSQPSSSETLEARYTRIASLAPASPEIQYGLGVALLSAETDGLAAVSPQTFFRQAIRLDDDYDQRVLEAYLRPLPEDEARRQFASAIPNTPQAHQRAARLLERSNWRQARLHYRTAMTLSRADPGILQAYAEALMRQRDFVTARDIWVRLREKLPQQPAVYLGLATALRHLEAWGAVVRTLQQLVAHFPQEASYHAQLAHAYGHHNLKREAEAAWKLAIQLQPQDVHSYLGLVRLYESEQKIAKAILMMQQVVAIAPEQARYQQALARLYEQSEHHDKAVQIYQRLASYRTDDPLPFYKLGMFAEQQGHLSRAVAYYRRAVRLKPKHAGFRKALDHALQEIANR